MIESGNIVDIAIGSSLSSGLIGGILLGMAKFGLARFAARVDKLSENQEKLQDELVRLKDERVAKVEKQIEQFEAGCQVRHDRLIKTLNKVEHMAADLANIVGWTKKLDSKIDRLAEAASAESARADGLAKWLENLDKSHNDHARDREAHRHG